VGGAHVHAAAVQQLAARIAELVELARSAQILQRAAAGPQQSLETAPQLARLLTLLDVAELCRATGANLAPLNDLSQASLTLWIRRCLDAQDRSSA
jgi:hypothetical protein